MQHKETPYRVEDLIQNRKFIKKIPTIAGKADADDYIGAGNMFTEPVIYISNYAKGLASKNPFTLETLDEDFGKNLISISS